MAKGNNTKAKIARVAWKLFHEKGYEETTIDEIILQSGTSKGSFYHYYSGKDELLASLPEIFDAKYEEVMQALDPEMDSFDKLMTLCFSVHDLIESDIPVGLLASLYSSQVVTKGDKHLLNQNRFYYKMVNCLLYTSPSPRPWCPPAIRISHTPPVMTTPSYNSRTKRGSAGGRLPAVCHITRLHICMHSARGQSSMITAFQTVAMRLESIQERQCLCCSVECV